MSQRYHQGQSRRGRPHPHYRSYNSPRGSPRDHHNVYRPPHQTGPMPHREGAYANPHMAHAMTSLLGSVVEARVTDGTVYEGILTACSPKLELFLEEVHDKAKSATRDNVERKRRFSWTEIVHISAKEEPNRRYTSDIFKTDTEISQSNGSSGSRDLQPFDFDEGSSVEHLDSDTTGWSVDDMFQVNKEKFDVSSTYDEEMAQYTTKLERDDTEIYRQREARAARIAQEIEAKDKKRYGIDDTGTEEEQFSAVVRQEVAPPPPAETTTFRPNGGVSSLSNENESVAPPPAAATVVGVNSIPKTDSSSTGSNSSSKSELLSDTGIQPVSGDSSTPTGLLDTPTSAKDDATSAESAGRDNVEIKGQDTTVTTSEQTGKDESSSRLAEENPSAGEPRTAAGAETPPRKEDDETVAPSSEAKEKENTIKTFKLNPDAKEFTPTNFSLPITPPTTSSSPALSSSSSSTRSSSSTPYLGGGGKKSSFRSGGRPPRGQHQQTGGGGSTFVQPDATTFVPSPTSALGQGGFVIQTQPFGLRPSVPAPHAAGQVYYAHMPQYPGAAGLIAQPGMIPPQQLVAATSPKFLAEMPTQPQVIGQHYPQTSQSPQFIPGQALLQPTVSQQQLMPTPQGLVSAHQPLFNVVQGGLATGGTIGAITGAVAGAATAGGLVGGVPFSPYHHHQALAAAASVSQQPGGGGGAGGVASQPLAGTPVAPSRQLFQHQVGK